MTKGSDLARAHARNLVGDGIAQFKGRTFCAEHLAEELGAQRTLRLNRVGEADMEGRPPPDPKRCSVAGCPRESMRVIVLDEQTPPRGAASNRRRSRD